MKDEFNNKVKEMLNRAVTTLGLGDTEITKEVQEVIAKANNDASSIGLFELKDAFEYLYLEINDLHVGYFENAHIYRICTAIENKTFHFKKNKATKKLWRQYKKERWKNDGLYVGTRLKWQTRLRRWFPGLNIVLPGLEDIIPLFIQRVIYKFKKCRAMSKHIKENGSLIDFVYFDRRFEPEHKCNSRYYTELCQASKLELENCHQ